MIIVNDITLRKEAEKNLAQLNTEKELLIERVFGIVSNDAESVMTLLDLSKSFTRSFMGLNFEAREELLPRLRELGRDLHTLKGSGGSMEFKWVARCCDELETVVAEYWQEKGCVDANGKEQIKKAFNAFALEMQAVIDLRTQLYGAKEDSLSITKADYAEYLEELKKGGFESMNETIYRFRMLNALKFSEFCAEFFKMVIDYGERLRKTIEPLTIATPKVRIERTIGKIVKGPVTHIIRNALDHGIEEDAAREKSGKGPGRISMALRESNHMKELEIADDGGGIDPKRVAASAVKKGFITLEQAGRLTDEQKQYLIFLNGFSTKDAATTISGRGVGMDAVISDIEKARGGVTVVSHVGQGTKVLIWVPKMSAK
jgi:chemotaxis protein histidine kinase CheA